VRRLSHAREPLWKTFTIAGRRRERGLSDVIKRKGVRLRVLVAESPVNLD